MQRQTFENYRHSTKNSFPKKIHEFHENYESYPSILQCVPRVLAHTLVNQLDTEREGLKMLLGLGFRFSFSDIQNCIGGHIANSEVHGDGQGMDEMR